MNDIHELLRLCYLGGCEAYLNGESLADNPWKNLPDEGEAWASGWHGVAVDHVFFTFPEHSHAAPTRH